MLAKVRLILVQQLPDNKIIHFLAFAVPQLLLAMDMREGIEDFLYLVFSRKLLVVGKERMVYVVRMLC